MFATTMGEEVIAMPQKYFKMGPAPTGSGYQMLLSVNKSEMWKIAVKVHVSSICHLHCSHLSASHLSSPFLTVKKKRHNQNFQLKSMLNIMSQ